MITQLRLLRNIGQFDSVSSGANITLGRLTVLYAENGRGKTTLSAIFRSLASGDPIPIAERQRLAAANAPHVVLECDGGQAIFQNNAWTRTLPDLVVFDDAFIDANVYSGLAVGTAHRQNMHELILGAQGITLSQQVQAHVDRIEQHNTQLRTLEAEIPAAERGGLTVDQFCALPSQPNVDEDILRVQRQLAAAGEQDPIRTTATFDTLSLPVLDVAAIERLLAKNVADLDASAAARVQAHLNAAGKGAEAWVSDGMQRVRQDEGDNHTGPCPFCASDLSASPVFAHYRAYFSESYRTLKRAVADAVSAFTRTHGGDVPASFERDVRLAVERRQFWSRFGEVPEVNVDTAAIARDWKAAREAFEAALASKQLAPLEPIQLPDAARSAAAAYEAHREQIAALSSELQHANETILLVKEQAKTGNASALQTDLRRLQATKARHTPEMTPNCDAYLREKAAKARTEGLRDTARSALNQYRTGAFPGFQASINNYLQRFNAGFRLDQVTAANTRTGPTCTYSVLINNQPVPVAGGDQPAGRPSFRNTLSAGDRNTLALAFFFASLDADLGLASKIVVIDDPVSSLDEHRSLTTVQELRRLAQRVGQVIVLSHSKPFLCTIWNGADRIGRAALRVPRDGSGSTIADWNVDQDSVTEHDRRHALLREYHQNGGTNSREVAESIRPVLEAFLRVARPDHFPPGGMLGQFRDRCRRQLGTPQQILPQALVDELHDLTEYANRFHHDTNAAYATELINDGELTGYVQRTLVFATR
ncbi:MAG TPA: AAA family ATPase [Polyangiaceae bacterium]|nr:AAA family ATPase [Polyangiaceae bacterium]